MGCLLELLPDDILRIIDYYKRMFEKSERFIRFLEYIIDNLIGIELLGGP